jgi:hypothetical protein
MSHTGHSTFLDFLWKSGTPPHRTVTDMADTSIKFLQDRVPAVAGESGVSGDSVLHTDYDKYIQESDIRGPEPYSLDNRLAEFGF